MRNPNDASLTTQLTTVMQLNVSDLAELLSLYCQSHRRWLTLVLCPVAVALNQLSTLLDITETLRERRELVKSSHPLRRGLEIEFSVFHSLPQECKYTRYEPNP